MELSQTQQQLFDLQCFAAPEVTNVTLKFLCAGLHAGYQKIQKLPIPLEPMQIYDECFTDDLSESVAKVLVDGISGILNLKTSSAGPQIKNVKQFFVSLQACDYNVNLAINQTAEFQGGRVLPKNIKPEPVSPLKNFSFTAKGVDLDEDNEDFAFTV